MFIYEVIINISSFLFMNHISFYKLLNINKLEYYKDTSTLN